jgi:hypothetical protein
MRIPYPFAATKIGIRDGTHHEFCSTLVRRTLKIGGDGFHGYILNTGARNSLGTLFTPLIVYQSPSIKA